MALTSQCSLPHGAAHTGPEGAPPAPSRALCPEDTRNPREEHESTAGLCWAAPGLIPKEPLPPSQTLLDAKPIAACTPQPSERPQHRSDSVFIFTGQHKMKCEELINAQSMVPWLPVTLDPWLSKLLQEWFLYKQNYSIMSAVCL